MTTVKFANPPLIEVVFGIKFKAPNFSSVHLGLYWETIRDRFPFQTDSPPNEESISYSSMPPLRRVWFESADRKKIIQIQENYFCYNWTKEEEEDEYPHFEQIFPEFLSEWVQFKKWWCEDQKELLEVVQYELTYLNLLDENSGWISLEDHQKIFSCISEDLNSFLEVPIFFDFRLAFSLPDDEGTLLVVVDQHIQERNNSEDLDDSEDAEDSENLDDSENLEDSEFVFFRLTAKSFEAKSELTQWFDNTHNYLVKVFLALTRKGIQKEWGRYGN
jgi:uncharacterized protein (TIGR04255 family)